MIESDKDGFEQTKVFSSKKKAVAFQDALATVQIDSQLIPTHLIAFQDGGCKYCNFNGGYDAEKALLLNTYDKHEAIGAMGAGVQLDLDGVPGIATWVSTPKCGYQGGFNISYCPMCGRKL